MGSAPPASHNLEPDAVFISLSALARYGPMHLAAGASPLNSEDLANGPLWRAG